MSEKSNSEHAGVEGVEAAVEKKEDEVVELGKGNVTEVTYEVLTHWFRRAKRKFKRGVPVLKVLQSNIVLLRF